MGMSGSGGGNGDKGPSLVPLLAAVATAIGTLGWVAFIGGAIVWISFSRAHLPAAEAVARVPSPVLVATGAEFVVWAVLAALATVAVLYMLDDPFQRRIDAWRVGRFEPILRGLLPFTLVAGTAIGFAFWVSLGYGHVPWPKGVIVVCAAGLAAGLVGAMLYSSTAKFAHIGVFAVVAVPLVMAVAMYFRAQEAPRVEPVAFMRTDGSPFVGFFIAQTTDRVYVGTFDQEAPDPCSLLPGPNCKSQLPQITVPARLLSLPTSEVQNLTVGPRKPLNAQDAEIDQPGPQSARAWAAAAALHLCDDADSARQTALANVASGASGPDVKLPTTCSDPDVQNLRTFAENEQAAIEASH
jgi:hypothetical protein